MFYHHYMILSSRISSFSDKNKNKQTGSLNPRGWLPWWFKWQRICLQSRRTRFNTLAGKTLRRKEWSPNPVFLGFPGGPDSRVCSVEDPDLIPGSGRSPGEGGWQATVHMVAKSQTQLSDFTLPGESHGRRSLEGPSSRGCRVGQDWATNTHTHTTCTKSWRNSMVLFGHKISSSAPQGNPQTIWQIRWTVYEDKTLEDEKEMRLC